MSSGGHKDTGSGRMLDREKNTRSALCRNVNTPGQSGDEAGVQILRLFDVSTSDRCPLAPIVCILAPLDLSRESLASIDGDRSFVCTLQFLPPSYPV